MTQQQTKILEENDWPQLQSSVVFDNRIRGINGVLVSLFYEGEILFFFFYFLTASQAKETRAQILKHL